MSRPPVYSSEMLRIPHTLKSLCKRKLVAYITAFIRYFGKRKTYKNLTDRTELMRLVIGCEGLDEYFSVSSPPIIANEICNFLMDCIAEILGDEKPFPGDEWWYVPSYTSKITKRPGVKEPCNLENVQGYRAWMLFVCRVTVKSIFRPTVTKLVCNSYHSLLSINLIPKLGNLTDITINNYYEKTLSKFVYVTPHLQKLTSNCCTNDFLEALSQLCPKLTYLNVNGSRHITDKGIKSISRMKRLEELHIFSSGMTVSLNSLEDMFKSLSQAESTLIKLSVFYKQKDIPSSHLSLLTEYFPCIESLSVHFEHKINLAPLQNLNHMHEIFLGNKKRISEFDFSCTLEMFSVIAPQIRSLHLYCIVGSDLMFIHDNFPSLVHLDYRFTDKNIEEPKIPIYSNLKPLPEFLTVKTLELYLNDWNMMMYVWTRFPRMNVLYTDYFVFNQPRLMLVALEMMTEDGLREVNFWGEPKKIQIDGRYFLLTIRITETGICRLYRVDRELYMSDTKLCDYYLTYGTVPDSYCFPEISSIPCSQRDPEKEQ